jgi:hypothetical protein
MIFRQLFDPASSTYTYLLGDSGEALLIDPVYEHVPRDLALLQELDLRLRTTLDTHVHADHVTGAWRLRQRCGSLIALAAVVNAEGVNRPLQHGERIDFGSRHLTVRATPGHTNGCLTYVLDDKSMAFTGDSLLIRGCGRTDFQVCVSASRLEHRCVRCEGVAIVTAEQCDGRPNRRDGGAEDSATSSAWRGILARDGHGVETKRAWRPTFLPRARACSQYLRPVAQEARGRDNCADELSRHDPGRGVRRCPCR